MSSTLRVAARLVEDKSGDAIYLITHPDRGGAVPAYAMVRDEFASYDDEDPETRHYNSAGYGEITDPAERAAIDSVIAGFNRDNQDWRLSFLIGEIYGR